MVKFTEDGMIDLERSSYADISNHYAGVVLERLVTNGGTGLRNALHEVVLITLQKHELELVPKANKEEKKAKK
jgi:hypothetical protein